MPALHNTDTGHHDHYHGIGHHHHHGARQPATTAFMIGIILNTLFVGGEVIAGLYAHSMALLSDAGHNLGDVSGMALSVLSFRLARARPTSSFTYGFKKTTVLAAIANAVILLIGIGILGYGAIARLGRPSQVQGDIVAWVAGAGILINGTSALLFFREKDHELNSKGAYLHLMMDAIVSAGVLLAGIIIRYTHYYWLDPAVSLLVLVIILISTWNLLTSSVKLSMDAVPESIDITDINRLMSAVPGVENIHHTHIWAISTTENALTTHVALDHDMAFADKMGIVTLIKHMLSHHNITHATIEIEDAQKDCPQENC